MLVTRILMLKLGGYLQFRVGRHSGPIGVFEPIPIEVVIIRKVANTDLVHEFAEISGLSTSQWRENFADCGRSLDIFQLHDGVTNRRSCLRTKRRFRH